MIIKRQKEYSKFTSSLGGAIKGAGKGAAIGAAFMPGWKLAAIMKKGKVAAGIAGVGALVGGAAGASMGWKSGKDRWEYDHDPKVREKVDREMEQILKEQIENARSSDKSDVCEFNYTSWKALGEKISVPEEFLKYVKFYKDFWSKKIDSWYNAIDQNKVSLPFINSFKSYFPIPVDSETAKDWYEDNWLCLATYNDAGDDGWLCYDTETKKYGIDVPEFSESLKKTITPDIKRLDDELSSTQINLIKEFINKINIIL